LSIGLAAAYAKECAVGPEFWCKSFQNAEDCGAIRHCTDTVWTYDKKYALSDSSTTCQWCQRILENTYKGIQKLASNEVCNFLLHSSKKKIISYLGFDHTHIGSRL